MTNIKILENRISNQKAEIRKLRNQNRKRKQLCKNQARSIDNLKETVKDMEHEILKLSDVVEQIQKKHPDLIEEFFQEEIPYA